MKREPSLFYKVAGAVLGLLLAGALPAGAAAPTLTVSPATVEIGAFFNGQTVSVSGTMPAGAQAVLEVVGSSADETLMRKGRRGGLWMNVGKIEVHDAPSLYLVMSTAKELLTSAAGETSWGYQSLQKRITFSGDIKPAERQEFLGQFLQLKESEKFYVAAPGALKVGTAAGGASPVKASFDLPSTTKTGTYKVCLSVIQGGKVTGNTCTDLKVAMVSFPAMLATMAYQHGLAYGILAVIIAIVVGFAMGFVFKGGGGH